MARTERPHKPKSYYVLIGTTVALTVFGLVMVFSASQATGLAEYQDSFYYLKKQILWMVIGFTALLVMSSIDYRWLQRMSWPLLLGSLALLVAVLIPGVGVTAGGAQRWIIIGPFNVQPSEIAKLAMVLFSADILCRRREKLFEFKWLAMPVLGVLAIVAGLIMAQPDMGTMLIVVLSVFVVLFVAGAQISHLIGLAGAGLGAIAGLIAIAPYRVDRIIGFWNPWKDPTQSGFQVIQSLIALGSGGLFGVGLGMSKQKFFYLPAAHTDFILAIIGEELGLIGTLCVIVAFGILAYVGIRLALRAQTHYGRVLAAGITSLIVFQAVINMGAVTGVLPVTGVPLPLISSGGTSLLLTLAAVGILANIASQEGQAFEGVIDARHYFRRRNRRPSVSSTRPRRSAGVS